MGVDSVSVGLTPCLLQEQAAGSKQAKPGKKLKKAAKGKATTAKQPAADGGEMEQ